MRVRTFFKIVGWIGIFLALGSLGHGQGGRFIIGGIIAFIGILIGYSGDED